MYYDIFELRTTLASTSHFDLYKALENVMHIKCPAEVSETLNVYQLRHIVGLGGPRQTEFLGPGPHEKLSKCSKFLK